MKVTTKKQSRMTRGDTQSTFRTSQFVSKDRDVESGAGEKKHFVSAKIERRSEKQHFGGERPFRDTYKLEREKQAERNAKA